MESECQEQTNQSTAAVILDIPETEMIRLDAICRLCANQSEKIIGIYSEEGISNDLPIKINLYLPVKVTEGESLPLQCCWNCASTVLAWHELVVASVEADRRLRELQTVSTNQLSNSEDEDTKISSSPEHEFVMKTEETHAEQINHDEGTFLLDNRRNNFTDYECSMCSLKFSSKNLLTAHKIKKHKRRTRNDINYNIFCDVCNKGYTRRFDMERHRKTKHSDVLKYVVAEDFVEDSTEGEYENKNNSLSVCKSTDFTCKTCEGKFEKQSELRVHERKFHGVFKFRRKRGEIVAEYFCDICNKGFTRNHDMKKHRRKQHPDVPTPAALLTNRKERASYLMRTKITGPDDKIYYKCETCDKVFRQSYNLMRHQTIHTGVRAYFCHICGKNFPSSNGLKRHITEHHYGVKKYSCEVCGKRFAASATRNEHLNIHTDTRPFICDICGKSFKQKASLHTHKLFHTNNFRFSCNVCGKKFRRGSELKIHTWLHTGHKPHQCHLCPSSFRLRQDLKRHIRVHDKLNECVCNECGSTFSQQKYLNNHKRTHKSHRTVSFLSTNIKQEESQVIIFDVHHSS